MGFDCSEIERYIFEYVNDARKKECLSELKFSQKLKDISKSHSHQMASAGHIWHGNGVHEAGGTAGENVALMHSGRVHGFNHQLNSARDIAYALHTNWMKSPGHRANILSSDFSYLGIGIVNRGNGYYATQLFNSGILPFGIPVPAIEFVLWWAIFALGIYLSGISSNYLKLTNLLLISLFTGLVIEIISKIYQIVKFRNTFKIDRWFVLWIVIHSFVFYLINQLVWKLDLFYFSLIFTGIIHIIWKLNKFHDLKEFIGWWSTYTLGLILVNQVWQLFPVNNLLLISLISGFLIEATSKFSQILRKGTTFTLDKWFVFWVLIFSVIYCGLTFIPLQNSTLITILTSLIITLIVYGIWKIDFYKKNVWIWIGLLAIILISIAYSNVFTSFLKS